MPPVHKLSAMGSLTTNKIDYPSMLAGNATYVPPSFESISTVNVGSGGAGTVVFSSIPQIYSHLQVRCTVRSAGAATYGTSDTLSLYVNSDGSTTYFNNELVGADGSAGTLSFSGTNNSTYSSSLGWMATSSSNANVFSSHIIDILDYQNTNKLRTIRTFSGYEDNRNGNGYGEVRIGSSLYQTNTTAISSLYFFVYSSANFAQYSSFALYGIRG